MTMRIISILLLISSCVICKAQTNYSDSLKNSRQKYIDSHEVVSNKALLDFFQIDPAYRVVCRFESARDAAWFNIPTSSGKNKIHRKYGTLHFTIKGTPLQLSVYQSQSLLATEEFRDYLFIPFTDLTTGEETYEIGRYLECVMGDIKSNKLVLDFNKAYNPYCAYTSGYNCPIPPKENALNIAIRAGEKKYKGGKK
jgi:uncharacterized protein (DUF1684 family)